VTYDLRPISPEERERLLAALNSESDKIMLRLLLETHRPLEDLREAKVSDLDRDRGLLRLRREGKEGKPEAEIIPLSPELLAAVEDYVEKNPGKTYLFEGRCGKPVGPKWIRCAIEPAAERLGLGKVRAAGRSSGTDRK
jgi:integrase